MTIGTTTSLVDFATVKIKEKSLNCIAVRLGDLFFRPNGTIASFLPNGIIAYVNFHCNILLKNNKYTSAGKTTDALKGQQSSNKPLLLPKKV